MLNQFHSELNTYIRGNDNQNATHLILIELSKALVKDRESFIAVLRDADIPVKDSATDLELIDDYIKNVPNNSKLLLGTAFLVNHRNQTVGFDGVNEVSDSGVKATYGELDEFFNVGGIIGSIIGAGGNVTGKLLDRQTASQRSASNQLEKQQEARRKMIQTILEQRRADLAGKDKGTGNKTILIVGGVAVLLMVGIGIYVAVKKNK